MKAKIRTVTKLHPETKEATTTSFSAGLRKRKDPTGRLWPNGLCRVEGDSAWPIMSEKEPEILVLRDS